jgi:hypothetical protein
MIGLAGAGAVALAGAWARTRFARWRRKDPAELERLRRLDVNRRGRISAGKIIDMVEAESGSPASRLVTYKYEVAGVTYEAAQDVQSLRAIAAGAYASLGQTVSVKYDPKKPANSIIACEEWSGVRLAEPDFPSPTMPSSREAPEKS